MPKLSCDFCPGAPARKLSRGPFLLLAPLVALILLQSSIAFATESLPQDRVLLAAPGAGSVRAEIEAMHDLTEADTSSFALVLGGGGARGFAEIGVLQVLEEEGLRPGLIVGCSMGAILGALYACGYTADELLQMVESQDWFSLFSNAQIAPAQLQGGWSELPDEQLSLLLDRFPPLPPRNLAGGRKITQLIGALGAGALLSAGNDFDRLPIPYRAVAVDLNSSQIVVLRGGSLARAAQASGTIPILLPPVRIEGRELVDGGFRLNNPVEVARALGFRRSLIVDVSNTQLPHRKSPGDLYQMWIRAMELQEYPSNLVVPVAGEVVLHIPLQKFRSLSFAQIDQVVRIGYEFAAARRDTLRSLRGSVSRVVDPLTSPTVRQLSLAPATSEAKPRVRVEHLELTDGDGMGVAEMRRRLQVEVGDELPLRAIYRRFNALEHTPGVESAWIEVDRSGEQDTGLVTSTASSGASSTPLDRVTLVPHLEMRRKPHLELAGHVITDDDAALLARLHQARLPLGGGEAALSYRYSERKAAGEFRLRQGIPPGSRFLLTTRLDWSRDRPWLYERGSRVDRLVIEEQGARLQLGFRVLHPALGLRLGVQTSRLTSYRESRLGLGEAQGPQILNGFVAELQSGTDGGMVHSRSLGFRVRYLRGVPDWGDLGVWRLEGGAVAQAEGPGKLRPSAAVGFVHGSPRLPLALQGRAGGPFNWVGLRREEILASRLLWLRGGLGWQLAETLCLSVSSAVGWRDELRLRHATPLVGVGTALSWRTPLGPFRVSWAVAERRIGTIFVQLGPEF
jgi:predicted acylesterase/phospholipase RssA